MSEGATRKQVLQKNLGKDYYKIIFGSVPKLDGAVGLVNHQPQMTNSFLLFFVVLDISFIICSCLVESCTRQCYRVVLLKTVILQ